MVSLVRRIGLLAVGLAVAAAAGGCAGRAANAPPPATAGAAGDDDVLAGLFEHHRYHHHGGALLFIAMSVDTLGVSPEQRATVDKISTDLRAALAPARTAEQNLEVQLADGLAAGTFDRAKIDTAVAQVAAAAATAHDGATTALNNLHAALTPPQRAALVDKVESHWAVWQKANTDAGDKGDGDHLAALAKDLELTPEQVTKIRAGLGDSARNQRLDPQEMSAHVQAFGEAFRGDSFDATKAPAADSANQHLAGWGAAHLARFFEAVSPVLAADQRAELVAQLRDHANHSPTAEGTP